MLIHVEWFHKKKRETNTTLPAIRAQISEFGRSQDFAAQVEKPLSGPSVSTRHAVWVLTDQCQSNMPDSLSRLGLEYVLVLTLEKCHYAKTDPRPLGLRSTAHDLARQTRG